MEPSAGLQSKIKVEAVTHYPTTDDHFVVDTDASLKGAGAVLTGWLSKAESNYCVTGRELLVMIKALRRFHPYLYSRAFTLHINHSSVLRARL